MMNRPELLISVFQFLMRRNPRVNVTSKEWLKLLSFADLKGYLYVGFEEDKIAVVTIAYRVKEFKESLNKKFPNEEEGNKLFVPIYISFSKDKNNVSKNVKDFFNKNPDVNQIGFYTDKSGLRIFNREKQHGKEERQNNYAGAKV